MELSQLVVQTCLDGVVLLRVSNPPVNAISTGVRRALLDAVEQADTDSAIRAIVITGAGKSFMAGADIRELGLPALPPSLPDLCNRIENCAKPVIAAMHGVALGGGLEIALSCHYRLAAEGVKLGLPEVLLGLMPGAGGTQRLPRLIGVESALALMLSGRHVLAKEALSLGIIDRHVLLGDAAAAGVQYAHELLNAGAGVRRSRDAEGLKDHAAAQALLDEARHVLAKKSRHLFSPHKIVEAVQSALGMAFSEGLTQERAAFLSCLQSPQCEAFTHAFLAERAVSKAPETPGAPPLPVMAVGIVGGGLMGAGIAVSAIDAGLCVRMVEQDDKAAARGLANVEKVFAGQVSKGRITQAGMDSALKRFSVSTDYQSLKDVDLAIEAVFEDMNVKKMVFERLNLTCKPEAVLATNTSYLDIDEIARTVSRPERVIGLHFFSPANIMPLLEIVVAGKTDAQTVSTAFEFAKKLRKVPVRAGVCDGFIGNRVLAVYRAAADHMMEDGASPYQIDRALRDFGFAMGPYQVADLAGGDIGWATRKRRAANRDPNARYVQIPDRLCERGWFGQKTGRGYYLYPQGSRTGEEDPQVLAIIDEERRRVGIEPKRFTDGEIVRRYLAAMINEGANVVFDGIALRPLDVDVTFLHGYGFPRFRGGPMKYADTIGLGKVLADINEFSVADPLFWKPSALLVDLVGRRAGFATLNNALS